VLENRDYLTGRDAIADLYGELLDTAGDPGTDFHRSAHLCLDRAGGRYRSPQIAS